MEEITFTAKRIGLVRKASRRQSHGPTASHTSLEVGESSRSNVNAAATTTAAAAETTAATTATATATGEVAGLGSSHDLVFPVRPLPAHAHRNISDPVNRPQTSFMHPFPAGNPLARLFKLPPELQLMVLSYLDFGDMERLRRTCRYLRQQLSKSLIRQVIPDIDNAIFATCYLCLCHDPSGGSIVAARRGNPRWPMSNTCIRCTLQNNGFMVGKKCVMASQKQAWICRWCGHPIEGECARNQPEFHQECRHKYETYSCVNFFFGAVQFIVAVVGSSLCTAYTHKDLWIGVPAIINLILTIWVVLLLTFRGLYMRTYHWSLFLELCILSTWIVPLYAFIQRITHSSFNPTSLVYAAMVFIVLNMVFRLLNVIGNVFLTFNYKWWRRHKPHNPWPRKAMHKFIMAFVIWTYSKSLEQEYPSRHWFSRRRE